MPIECPGCWGKGLLQKLTVFKDNLAEWPLLEVQSRDFADSGQIVPVHHRLAHELNFSRDIQTKTQVNEQQAPYQMYATAAEAPATAFREPLLPWGGTVIGLLMLSFLSAPLPMIDFVTKTAVPSIARRSWLVEVPSFCQAGTMSLIYVPCLSKYASTLLLGSKFLPVSWADWACGQLRCIRKL